MATIAQILANQLNAHRSTGPTSPARKQASSKNRTTHALCQQHDNRSFYVLDDENLEKFYELRARLVAEYQPQTETETILVRRLADHEWLRTRALRLQQSCLFEEQHVLAIQPFALYLRYQTNHERAFYKALTELQKLQAQRSKTDNEARSQAAEEVLTPSPSVPSAAPVLAQIAKQKEQIGFESQKGQQAASQPASAAHTHKKEPEKPAPVFETTPGGLQTAA